MAAIGLKCYLCDSASELDLKTFFYHLKIFHNVTDANIEFKCGYPNCNKVIQTKKGISEHMMNCKFKNCVPLHETLVRNHKNDTNNSSIELQLESVSRSFHFRGATQTIGVDNQINVSLLIK